MELHQLRYLASLSETGSFTATAAALHVSQPSVSAQIAKLERELGHRLLDRAGRRVRLTPAGEQIVPHARAALDAVATVGTVADELAGVVRGRVRLGTVIGCTIPGYLAGFAEFRNRHPGVFVEVREDNSDRLITDLRTGALDVAVVAHCDPLPSGVSGRVVIGEPLAAIVAADHAWARSRAVTCAQLAEATVLSLPPGTGVRSALDATAAREGVTVEPAVAAYSPESVLALARLGSGVGVLTASMAAGADGVAAVPVARSARNQLSLAVGAAPSAAARAMTAALAGHLLPDG